MQLNYRFIRYNTCMATMSMIALAAITIYLVCTAVKCKEIPDSISETAYIVDKPEIFTAIMSTEALVVLPALLEHCTENTAFLAFLTVVGLFMVAFTPKYKQENGAVHYVGGILAGVASQALIALNCPTILFTWLAYPILYLVSKEDYTFWAELICLINIFAFIL